MKRQFRIYFSLSKMLNMEKNHYIILNYWVGIMRKILGIARLAKSADLGSHI